MTKKRKKQKSKLSKELLKGVNKYLKKIPTERYNEIIKENEEKAKESNGMLRQLIKEHKQLLKNHSELMKLIRGFANQANKILEDHEERILRLENEDYE